MRGLLDGGAREGAAMRVEFAEMRDGLLDDLTADADGPDELPVGVTLPSFRRVV